MTLANSPGHTFLLRPVGDSHKAARWAPEYTGPVRAETGNARAAPSTGDSITMPQLGWGRTRAMGPTSPPGPTHLNCLPKKVGIVSACSPARLDPSRAPGSLERR